MIEGDTPKQKSPLAKTRAAIYIYKSAYVLRPVGPPSDAIDDEPCVICKQ